MAILFKSLALAIILLLPFSAQAEEQEKLILITLDGVRWQEIFRGPEDGLLKEGTTTPYKADSTEVGRQRLMPFFWNKIAKEGTIRGNRDAGSSVAVQNPYWFSYPGYAEILTGLIDPTLDSNDKVNNPNITFLEWANRDPRYKGKVAAFTSWDVFDYIINEERSGLPVNAGYEDVVELDISAEEKLLNALSRQLPPHSERPDALTFNYALTYLKRNHPHLLYIALDETDHFAHGDNYTAYLNAIHRMDAMIGSLWAWVEADPDYRGKTTLIITTDHGRGKGSEWTNHGFKIKGSNETWIAIIGPGATKSPLPKQTKDIANWIAERLKFDMDSSN